jgi:hypothetical protein
VHWWLRCPKCDRRVVALYALPGERRLACRHCHDLTYQSRQVSDKRLAYYRTHPKEVDAMLLAFVDGKGRPPNSAAIRVLREQQEWVEQLRNGLVPLQGRKHRFTRSA